MQLPIEEFALIGFFLAVITMTLYGVALAYHLFTYGEKKTTAMTSVLIYAVGATVLIVAMFTAYSQF